MTTLPRNRGFADDFPVDDGGGDAVVKVGGSVDLDGPEVAGGDLVFDEEAFVAVMGPAVAPSASVTLTRSKMSSLPAWTQVPM